MVKAKCQNKKCNYEWDTKSLMLFVSCPSCRNKVQITREVEEVVEDDDTK